MGILDTIVKTTAIKAAERVAMHASTAVINYAEKQDKAYIKVPASADDYNNRNYEEVRNELFAYGFYNIAVLEKKDLIKGWLTKDGSIEEISINGKSNFRKNARFRSDARVVIVYHTFRNSR